MQSSPLQAVSLNSVVDSSAFPKISSYLLWLINHGILWSFFFFHLDLLCHCLVIIWLFCIWLYNISYNEKLLFNCLTRVWAKLYKTGALQAWSWIALHLHFRNFQKQLKSFVTYRYIPNNPYFRAYLKYSSF